MWHETDGRYIYFGENNNPKWDDMCIAWRVVFKKDGGKFFQCNDETFGLMSPTSLMEKVCDEAANCEDGYGLDLKPITPEKYIKHWRELVAKKTTAKDMDIKAILVSVKYVGSDLSSETTSLKDEFLNYFSPNAKANGDGSFTIDLLKHQDMSIESNKKIFSFLKYINGSDIFHRTYKFMTTYDWLKTAGVDYSKLGGPVVNLTSNKTVASEFAAEKAEQRELFDFV